MILSRSLSVVIQCIYSCPPEVSYDLRSHVLWCGCHITSGRLHFKFPVLSLDRIPRTRSGVPRKTQRTFKLHHIQLTFSLIFADFPTFSHSSPMMNAATAAFSCRTFWRPLRIATSRNCSELGRCSRKHVRPIELLVESQIHPPRCLWWIAYPSFRRQYSR